MLRAFLILFIFSINCFAQTVGDLDVDDLTVAQISRLVYSTYLKDRAFVFDSAVETDTKLHSFRYRKSIGEFLPFWHSFLHGSGYQVINRSGVDVVQPIPEAQSFSLAEDPNKEIFTYRPRFRDGAYLVDMLSPLFRGKFTSQRLTPAPGSSLDVQNGVAASAVAPSGSAGSLESHDFDVLVFAGDAHEVKVLKGLLAQVDVSAGQLVVSGVVYEVQFDSARGNALSLVASLLKGRLGLGFGPADVGSASNFVSFKSSDFNVIVDALDSDSHFKQLSNPQVRVTSGSSSTFQVGQEVPTLSSVTYNGVAGNPTQSVSYKSSGVIFTVKPVARESSVDVSVDQQISNFIQTTTGVNGSPTLTKRQLQTLVSLHDDEAVVIAGLRSETNSDARTGLSFLPVFMQAKTVGSGHSEIILFLKVARV